MRRKTRVSYTYTLIYHFMCSSVFSVDPSFQPDGYPFSISYSVGLLMNSLSFHFPEKFLFHPCFWRIFLLDIKFSYFSFSTSKVLFILFCLIVFNEKSAIFINFCSLYILSPSAPQSYCFQDFIFVFQQLDYDVLRHGLFYVYPSWNLMSFLDL